VRAEFATLDALVDLLVSVAEEVSLRFDRWEEWYVRGPSLYFLVVSGVRIGPYADALGDERWPVEAARRLPADLSAVARVAHDVARERDGAVLVAADGTIQAQMVRVRAVNDDALSTIDYPDWMSAKQLSALEASTRPEVLAAVTLSEEDGRVTVFRDGAYEDATRDALGGRWRVR
jgi:hypothetical protein